MIDFVSTRTGTDPTTAGCARLLSFLIAVAIRDASTTPTKAEFQARRNLDERAGAAIHWLFGTGSPFATYADLIGSSAPQMRRALLESVRYAGSSDASARIYTHSMRRHLQTRHRWAYGGGHDAEADQPTPVDNLAANAAFVARLAASVAADLDGADLDTQPAPLVA